VEYETSWQDIRDKSPEKARWKGAEVRVIIGNDESLEILEHHTSDAEAITKFGDSELTDREMEVNRAVSISHGLCGEERIST